SDRIPGLPKTSPCAASFSTWTRGDCAKSKYLNTSAPPDPRSLFVVHRPHNSCFRPGGLGVDPNGLERTTNPSSRSSPQAACGLIAFVHGPTRARPLVK